MKKKFSIFVAVMFIFSIIPLAFAELNQVENTAVIAKLDKSDEKVVALDNIELKKQIRAYTGDEKDYNLCVQKAKNKLPDVEKQRIEESCKILVRFNNDMLNRSYLKDNIENLTSKERLRVANILVQKNTELKIFISSLSENNSKKFLNLDRARQKEVISKGSEELNKYMLKKIDTKNAYQKREIAKEKLQQAEKKYQNSVAAYTKAKNQYREAKQNFDDAVNSGNDTTSKKYAKLFLINAADMVIQSMEKIKEKANSNDDLTEDELDEIVSEIDNKIQEMKNLKDAVDKAETKEEIKEEGQKIIKAWKTIQNRLKLHAAKLVEVKVGEIISRSEALERKLDRILYDMEEKGINILEYDEKLDYFSEQINDARNLYAEGKELFIEARNIKIDGNLTESEQDEIKELTNEAKEYIRKAHEKLKNAHETLVNLFKELKSKGGKIDDSNDETGYYVEEVEESDNENEEDSNEDINNDSDTENINETESEENNDSEGENGETGNESATENEQNSNNETI